MSEPQDNPAAADLKRALAEIAKRLAPNPDFQAYIALSELIARLSTAPTQPAAAAPTSFPQGSVPQASMVKAAALFPEAPAQVPMKEKRITLGDFAAHAVAAANRPLSTQEIMEEHKKRGLAVSAGKPRLSLTSTLCRDERFESVMWQGKPAWWFKGRPVPGSMPFTSPQNGATKTTVN